MNGNVFECFHEQGDRKQFPKTLEALGEYTKKTVKYPEDLASLFGKTITLPTLSEPKGLNQKDADDTVKVMIKEQEIKDYVKRRRQLRGNLAAIFAVAWGQCSEPMRAKLKSLDEYEK